MTKKEKAILKLAQKWVDRVWKCPRDGYHERYKCRAECGRALLKILEGEK